MIPGIVAWRSPSGTPPSPIDTILGATSTVNVSVGTLTMAVPAGATTGDKLLVVLRSRADRSFTIPAGWTTLVSTAVPSGSSNNTDVRVYVLQKDYAGETNLSFVQSTTAACSGMVILLRGQVGAVVTSFTSPVAYTKTENSSYMLVLSFNNNYTTVTGTTPRVTSPTGYTQIGHSYFINSTEFYGIFADKKGLESSGLQSIAISWPGSTTSQRYAVAIEIKQP